MGEARSQKAEDSPSSAVVLLRRVERQKVGRRSTSSVFAQLRPDKPRHHSPADTSSGFATFSPSDAEKGIPEKRLVTVLCVP